MHEYNRRRIGFRGYGIAALILCAGLLHDASPAAAQAKHGQTFEIECPFDGGGTHIQILPARANRLGLILTNQSEIGPFADIVFIGFQLCETCSLTNTNAIMLVHENALSLSYPSVYTGPLGCNSFSGYTIPIGVVEIWK